MKNVLLWCVIAVLFAVHIAFFVRDLGCAGARHGANDEYYTGLDFSMRRNESVCVLKGINPYDLWTKKSIVKPYYPFTEKPDEGFSEPVNAYTPWEYVAAMPYACIEKQTAWCIHLAMIWLAFITLAIVAYRIGGNVAIVPVLLLVIPFNVDLGTGNYATIIAAAIALMMVSLNRGDKIIPAVLWSIAMFKPQMSVLLAVPLILRRQWRVGMIAAGTCLGLSFVSACLCHAPVVDLMLQVIAACSHGFVGCALMPEPFLELMKALVPVGVLMAVPMVLGLLCCLLLTWRLRGCKNWLVLSVPCLICSVSWTYVQPYSYVLTAIFSAIVAVDMSRNPTAGRFIVGVPAILLWARFARGAEIVVGKLIPAMAPIAGIVCQLSATVAFLLSVVYLWRYTDSLVAMSDERKREGSD